MNNIFPNPVTSFNPHKTIAKISNNAFVHPYSVIIGDVTISDSVLVSPFASIRADEGSPIFVGENSNIQDGVVMHGLKDEKVEFEDKKYSIYVGERTSISHQSQVHGPCFIGNDCFVGMQSFVFNSTVGNNIVIEPGSRVIGVTIPSGKYVPTGAIVQKQHDVFQLPNITDLYKYKDMNEKVVKANIELLQGYLKN